MIKKPRVRAYRAWVIVDGKCQDIIPYFAPSMAEYDCSDINKRNRYGEESSAIWTEKYSEAVRFAMKHNIKVNINLELPFSLKVMIKNKYG